MTHSEIRGKTIGIVGFAKEGRSVAAWLGKRFPDCRVLPMDRETDGDGYLDAIDSCDTLIRSPGVSPYEPRIVSYLKNGGHVTSATNIFFSLCRGITVGITGTKGKSTTSSLIAHILSGAYPDVRLVGNIGSPMVDALDGATDKTIFVIELSSHQLVDIRYSPHIAVMLGIVPEHLDYYPDLMTYAAAKANIVKYQSDSDMVVYNPDHLLVSDLVENTPGRKITYGIGNKFGGPRASIQEGVILLTDGKNHHPVMKVTDVPLLGNSENVLAAITVCDLMHVGPAEIARLTKSFRSLPHRLQYVGVYKDIRFYNDSLATIPDATVHALEALGSDVSTLIAGGYDRNLSFAGLGRYLRNHPVQTLLLFPDTGQRIMQEVCPDMGSDSPIRCIPVSTMEEAVRMAYQSTPKGKVCLLSPASASYNLFKNYEDRGNAFMEWVRKMGNADSVG